jgi:phospholipase C
MATTLSDRIKHVVVLMLENRSFDHFFGFTPAPQGQSIDGLLGSGAGHFNLLDPAKPESASNPRFTVGRAAPDAVHDKMGPPHSYHGTSTQLCNQSSGPDAAHPVHNNGFVRAYKDDLLRRVHNLDKNVVSEVMQSFTSAHLPAIQKLAAEFCLCDHWHCEVPGPTMPNRMYVHAATSEGYVHNAFSREFDSKTVYELFQEKHLSWATYFHDLNEVLQFKKLPRDADHFRRFEQRWAADVRTGALPSYSFILPRFMNKKATNGSPAQPANSQHAPEDVRFGELLIADVYDALAANAALWRQTLLIVTYDEHGGFYDHVAPPAPVPNPDGINSPNPDDASTFSVPAFAFDRLGLRVPCVLASPWIEPGVVEHRQLQHTSIIQTVREIFSLGGPLNQRDKSARSFADLLMHRTKARTANEMPARLPRPSVAHVSRSSAAGVPVLPADEPLDDLTTEWVQGVAALTARRSGPAALAGAAAVAVPTLTQGDASELVAKQLHDAFGI